MNHIIVNKFLLLNTFPSKKLIFVTSVNVDIDTHSLTIFLTVVGTNNLMKVTSKL